MAESMVTRVARILEPQAWAALGTGDTLAYKNRRTSSLRKARAAIEAMKEPTVPMIDAALEVDGRWSINMIPRIEAAWRAMNRAALAETKE